MPPVDKLLLEEALLDSPQTRSLLSVFEEDAGTLTEFTNQLLQAMQRVYGAQNEMSIATQQLSKQLIAYEKQNFALSKGDDEVISTLHRFARVVDELNSLHTELAKQVADTMIFPMIQFRERDLTEVSTLKDLFLLASNEHDVAMAKYSKLPKKRENEKLKAEVVAEVSATRRKQHHSSLQYYCALNALQHRKRVAMLDPLLGFTQAQINFFKMGVEMFSKKLDDFLSSVATMVQSIQGQLDTEAETMRLTQQELLLASETTYMPDNNTTTSKKANRNLLQKAGYLNIRTKTGLVSTSWDRLYFFTQGGNLMCQPRGAVAGGLILDLDNCSVMAVDCEDRRYCFQIVSPSGKMNIILQAEGKQEYEEWICTINNISRQIYLTDNPEAIAIRLNETAVQAVTPMSTFQKKHESFRPKQVESDGAEAARSEKSVTEVPESADPLIIPGTPIRFDLCPASEDSEQYRSSSGRTNPFGESCPEKDATPEDSLLHQVFTVRFLGSIETKTDQGDEVIYETMRQVLAARAIHNVFRMTEYQMVVSSRRLRFIDPQTQNTISFPLSDVPLSASHQDNKRLIGFVARAPDLHMENGASLNCCIFETNDDGNEICSIIDFGRKITQVEKDPEALAALMKATELSADGKFFLLGQTDKDETDACLESEA
ncbi:DCC-interacting protein 13-beta isoform X1 [Amblyraja radiata]|uniref:DCC-interacting protein 13-beta isoform X1 n=1 Tax=Amblyraja radiata TaxID=386614 RepID=UPI001403145D|nr:DCC-interacting protein 13-beta isoform X1 [Amblyraja radiata]